MPSSLRTPPRPASSEGATGASGGESATAATDHVPAAQSTSSVEYIVNGIKQHHRTFTVAAAVLLLAAAGLGYWFFARRPSNATLIESIAVLPFENNSSEPDTEYLSDGLTESLIYRLSQFPDLRVSPRTSVFRYKGKEADPIKAGNELGVSTVLSGRITQRGDNLTISAELTDVRYNKQLWGEHYDRRSSDLLTTQREIAIEITERLKGRLSGKDLQLASKQYTESNEAYQSYLKGRFYWNKRTGEAIKKSIEYFNQAIEKDPRFALAYAGLADSYVVPGNFANLVRRADQSP